MTGCVDCQASGPLRGRGLCPACYSRHKRRGTLADFPRVNWAADELLNEWVLLRDDRCSVTDAAARLGVTFAALDRALCRAVARGDSRGRRTVFGRAVAS